MNLGPADGPDRIHFLVVDGERRGADCRAEVPHVHDDRGHDGGGAVHQPVYTLTVQSTAADRDRHHLEARSDGGTTNYTVTGIAYGTSVNLQAPATDPSGYTFSQWTVNGAAQTGGPEVHHVHMTAATTAVALYMPTSIR